MQLLYDVTIIYSTTTWTTLYLEFHPLSKQPVLLQVCRGLLGRPDQGHGRRGCRQLASQPGMGFISLQLHRVKMLFEKVARTGFSTDLQVLIRNTRNISTEMSKKGFLNLTSSCLCPALDSRNLALLTIALFTQASPRVNSSRDTIDC